jgi:hypothetical protein
VITEGNRDYCFVEDLDYKTNRGCISVYELHKKTATPLGVALAEPFHLSFPFLFRFNSKIYMVPETSQNRDIRVYESVSFPSQWSLSTVLMSNLSAADTMIFEHNGLWWLFCNIDPLGFNNHCSELSIFYADNPLTQDWKPHAKNPVIIDPTKARNGGILFEDGKIYRVAQYQGFNLYGKAVSIHEIAILTPDEYLEKECCQIKANFFKKPKRTHHLHSNGHISVFDYAE